MADFVGPSSLPAPVQEFFNTGILSTPTAQYIHNLICRQDMMPEGSGRKMRYARYNDLPSSTTPLDGFNDGPPVELTRVDIDAQISWYGQYGYVSEQVIISNQDPVLNAFALRFGVSLRKSEDELIRNKLATTLSSVDCVNGTNGKNMKIAVVKSSLIDLELCNADNRAEGNCHGERLSEKNHSDMICDSLTRLATA